TPTSCASSISWRSSTRSRKIPEHRRRLGRMKDATPLTAVVSLACLLSIVIVHAQGVAAPDAAKLQQMTARFAPTDIGADLSKLTDADRRVLAQLVEASTIIDALFLPQVWAGNDAMLIDLVRDQSPAGRARLGYFLI